MQSISSSIIPEELPIIHNFKIISYNIDGLNDIEIISRTSIILSIIISENPDVVFLQEVVSESKRLIISTLMKNNFNVFGDETQENLGPYFTLTFINKKFSKSNTVDWERLKCSSMQGRNILKVTVKDENLGSEIQFLNCHLESTGKAFQSPCSTYRMEQLTTALTETMKHTGPAIVAGDLNIRNNEAESVISKIQKLFPDQFIDDAAAILQKKPSHTWFLPNSDAINNNVSARFDRMYSNRKYGLKPSECHVIGSEHIFDQTESLPYYTPSDHVGLLVTYTLEPDNPSNPDTKKSETVNSIPSQKKRRGKDRDTSQSIIDLTNDVVKESDAKSSLTKRKK